MATVSLCLITKNEKNNLKQCVDSVKDLVDEIIVVDTGSSDKTKEIAKELGAKTFDFKWVDDFSAARNESLKKATCDWILVLDADEVIAEKDVVKIKKLLGQHNEDDSVFGIELIQRSYTNDNRLLDWVGSDDYKEAKGAKGYIPSALVRLFRNNKEIMFRNKVHELVEYSIEEKKGKIVKTEIPIHHYGYVDDKTREIKREMYLRIGLEQIKLTPKDPKPYYEVAQLYRRKMELGSAIKYFEKVSELDPGYKIPFTNLGEIFQTMKREDEAIEAYEKAIKFKQGNVVAYYNLALLFYNRKEFERAEGLMDRALKINPKDGRFYIAMKDILLATDRADWALKVLNQGIINTPKYLELYRAKCQVCFMMQNFDEIIKCLDMAIATGPNNKSWEYIEFYINKANMLAKLGRFEEGVKVLEKAVSLNPERVDEVKEKLEGMRGKVQ